jgi:hypothetical protein
MLLSSRRTIPDSQQPLVPAVNAPSTERISEGPI